MKRFLILLFNILMIYSSIIKAGNQVYDRDAMVAESMRFADIQGILTEGIHDEVLYEIKHNLPTPNEVSDKQKERLLKAFGSPLTVPNHRFYRRHNRPQPPLPATAYEMMLSKKQKQRLAKALGETLSPEPYGEENLFNHTLSFDDDGYASESSSQDTATFDREDEENDSDVLLNEDDEVDSEEEEEEETGIAGEVDQTNSHSGDESDLNKAVEIGTANDNDDEMPAIKRIETPPFPKEPAIPDFDSLGEQLSTIIERQETAKLDSLFQNKTERQIINIFDNLPNIKELIFQAAENGYVTFIKKAASNLSDLSIFDEENAEGKTPLMVAVESGHGRAAQLILVEAKGIKKIEDYDEKFLKAAEIDRDDIILFFLNCLSETMDKRVEIRNQDGFQAIHLAAQNGSIKTLKLLIEKYYKPHLIHLTMQTTFEGDTPLHLASRIKTKDSEEKQRNKRLCVEELLKSNFVDSTIKNNYKQTPWTEIREKEKRDYGKIKKAKLKNKEKFSDIELKESVKPDPTSEAYYIRRLLKAARPWGGNKIDLQTFLEDPDRYEKDLGGTSTTTKVVAEIFDDEDQESGAEDDETYLIDSKEPTPKAKEGAKTISHLAQQFEYQDGNSPEEQFLALLGSSTLNSDNSDKHPGTESEECSHPEKVREHHHHPSEETDE